jgi:hypothetical protein
MWPAVPTTRRFLKAEVYPERLLKFILSEAKDLWCDSCRRATSDGVAAAAVAPEILRFAQDKREPG